MSWFAILFAQRGVPVGFTMVEARDESDALKVAETRRCVPDLDIRAWATIAVRLVPPCLGPPPEQYQYTVTGPADMDRILKSFSTSRMCN